MNNLKRKKLSPADFILEASCLTKLKRTGWQILGDGEESIADHSFMVSVISYILSKALDADIKKTLLIALFHDFYETRTGDIYKLADLYVKVDEEKAIKDSLGQFKETKELQSAAFEYEENRTLEANIVHDADKLALLVNLKKLIEKENVHAREWFDANKKALKLSSSQKLALELEKTDSQNWWRKAREKLHKRL